jgi:hypothetical protein
MSIVLSSEVTISLAKTIGLIHHQSTEITIDNVCNTCVPDDNPFHQDTNNDDLALIEMIQRRIGNFNEIDINQDTFYVVINRISVQEIGSSKQERAGYIYLLVRKADNIPCMHYYARDKENVKSNFDHKWLKWEPEFANWIIYDATANDVIGKIVGSLLE